MIQAPITTRKNSLKTDEIAVLILSTQAPEYRDFKRAISATWKKNLVDAGVHVYFYSGDHSHNEIIDDEIHLVTSDKLGSTAKKLKDAIKILFTKNPNVKLIYRTNLSSYIDVDNFLKFIDKYQLGTSAYSGVIGETTYLREYFYGNRLLHTLFRLMPIGQKIIFASGSGFFIGIEHARKLIDLEDGNELIDDVMVAKVLNIFPSSEALPIRFDIQENGLHKMPPDAYHNLVKNKFLFHYRFKTKDRKNDAALLESFDNKATRYNECTYLK